MKSVRLDAELEARLEEAARVSGESASAIIRRGIEQQCDALLGQRPDNRWADVIGAAASGKGGVARRTGRAFTELLTRQRRAAEK